MASEKTVLFISYDGMTDPLGQSQVIPYLEGLSKYGYQLIILSCEKKHNYAQNRERIASQLAAAQIQWYPISYTKRPPVLSTLWDVYRLRKTAAKICRNQQVQMVHTRPGIPALVGLWLKRKYGVKFLNDIREFFADSRVDGGMWKKDHFIYGPIYRYFKRKEHEEVAASDGIVCLTYAALEIVKRWPSFKPGTPLQVIPCSADLDLFNPERIGPEEQDNWRLKLGIAPGDIVLSYLGSIGGWYLTAEMMKFCALFWKQEPAAKFLFISPHRHEQIQSLAVKAGIPAQKIIMTTATRTQVPILLSLSTYALFFIKPCYSKLSSSPTKHGEIMAMGIPLITNSGVGDVQQIVQQYESGVVLESFDHEAMSAAIAALKKATPFDTAKIKKGAGEFYALHNAVEKYGHLYAQVLNPPPPLAQES